MLLLYKILEGVIISQIDILGVYPIKSTEPCHLIELSINSINNPLDISKITQEDTTNSEDNWQVPYLEHILDFSGNEILADDFEIDDKPELWKENIRLVFFFHYLKLDKPLITPFGDISLPAESELPNRLNIIKYEPID